MSFHLMWFFCHELNVCFLRKKKFHLILVNINQKIEKQYTHARYTLLKNDDDAFIVLKKKTILIIIIEVKGVKIFFSSP